MSNAERLAADPTITHLDGYKYLLRTVAAADGDPAMLLAVPYLLIASICTNALADGAPDWLERDEVHHPGTSQPHPLDPRSDSGSHHPAPRRCSSGGQAVSGGLRRPKVTVASRRMGSDPRVDAYPRCGRRLSLVAV